MKRIPEILILYEQMQSSKKFFFSELKPSDLREDLCVVYAITNFRTNEVLYVGKTTKLRRRLYTNHLMGNLATARLKKYLIDDPEIKDVSDLDSAKQYIKNNCYFQYIEESDMRKRGQLEGLFSYLLNVRYVDKEH
jgi:hypothetical protein